jgi:hypothetical protein
VQRAAQRESAGLTSIVEASEKSRCSSWNDGCNTSAAKEHIMKQIIGWAAAVAVVAVTPSAHAQESQWNPNGPESVPAYPPPARTEGPARPDGPARAPYVDGEPVPEGYHVESSPRWGLAGTGIALGAALWAASLIAAIKLDAEASKTVVDEQGGVREDPEYSAHYTPMFVPVVGPFITIGTADAKGTGAAILALDGVLQAGFLSMAIAGFASPKLELVKNRDLKFGASASPDGGGLVLSGSM